MKHIAATIALAALAARSPAAQQQPAQSASPSDASSATGAPLTPIPKVPKAPRAGVTATPAPDPVSTSRDPAKVVVAWARAMSLKQWGTAYLYWGDHGARSGLTLAQFAAKWNKLANPEFELHPGTTEGGAGSLYYTAPVVLIDGARHTRGEIVLRRVNDIDGASAEQLRWHIENLSIEP